MQSRLFICTGLAVRTVSSFRSTSILMNSTWGNSCAYCMKMGLIFWHGPHHAAVKSTTTSCSPALAIMSSNSALDMHMCVRELALQLIPSWATLTNVQAEHGPSLFGDDQPILFDLRLGPTKCFTQRGAWSCRRQLNGKSRLLKGKRAAAENPSSQERHSISVPSLKMPGHTFIHVYLLVSWTI